MRSYTNPVYGGYFADPFVWRHGSEYFAIGTGADEARGAAAPVTAAVFPLLRSPDLVRWRPAGRALVRPDVSLGDTFWAPEVVCCNDTWFLYYSVGFDDRLHQLRVAQSAHPLGPYVDCAGLTTPGELPFAIDPHPFRDDDGQWYLFHARDFLDSQGDSHENGAVRPGTALVVARLETMTRLSPDVRTVLRAQCDWQRFAAEREMYGRVLDWHTLEGPCVVRDRGRYYCFYSGGCWQNDTYGVDYAVAAHVLGPYDGSGNEHGPRLLRSVPGSVVGPGHCSIVQAPAPQTRMLVYHAWDAAMTARRMCMDELTFEADGPHCAGPSSTPQELPGTGAYA